MTAVHNSSGFASAERRSAESGRRRAGLEGLCTRAWGELGRWGRGIRWYMTTLMGDSAYQTYVAHHRRHHPDEEPMTERRFWRQRMDDQDRNPGARCC